MSDKTVSLFEFDFLVNESSIDDTQMLDNNVKPISDNAYQYLKKLCLRGGKESQLLNLRIVNRLEVLQVKNYAGVIFTPDKTQIEILPKIGRNGSHKEARDALLMMLKALKGFRHIETKQANIATQKMTLLEVFITQFLQSVNTLVKRGLRSEYVTNEDNLAYLKGKLNVGKQIRYNFINKHKFHVEYDAFIQDRPANRLLHSALCAISSYTQSVKNQKLLQDLFFVFADIPQSRDYKVDFTCLKLDRGMDYYRLPLNWARLILDEFSPHSMQGKVSAPSLLFPMESVFESYVAKILANQVAKGCDLKKQVQSKKLVSHDTNRWFNLKPDLVIEEKGAVKVVLDTKWKVLNQNKKNGTDKYGLSQADFYQMFAYGHKYLQGAGELFLIYPRHDNFQEAIEHSFDFDEDKMLRLWAIPFDVFPGTPDKERLILPAKCALYQYATDARVI